MVSRARLKSILTGLALYAMAAAIVGYFGVNAYTGKYGLNARQELDQEIVALTSELAQLKRERARSEQRVSLLRSDRPGHAGRAGALPARLRQSARSRPDDPGELTTLPKVEGLEVEGLEPDCRLDGSAANGSASAMAWVDADQPGRAGTL
jgi:cell division protein FtsB